MSEEGTMKKGLMLAVIVFLAAACTMPPVATTPEEVNYLAKVNAQPLTFRVPAALSNDAWGRIQSWIGRFSIYLKIKTVSDYVIETEHGTLIGTMIAYSASRAPMGEQAEFTIRAWTSSLNSQVNAKQNGHILAYYAATGELMEKFSLGYSNNTQNDQTEMDKIIVGIPHNNRGEESTGNPVGYPAGRRHAPNEPD
jgi:hypothetical protein